MKALITRIFLATFLFAVISVGVAKSQSAAADISESEITSLKKELAEAADESSSTRMRRAYKSVVRDGEKLLKSSPKALNRYHVLDIVLQSQKRLLVQEKSNENRDALLETCAKIAEAPDELADLRFEADLLLMEREMSIRNADVNERAKELQELIARYRDTSGEAKSLIFALQIAPKLEAFNLEMQILRTMQDRFSDHHGVIEFRRKSLAAGRIEALFRGTFTRTDGTSLKFPVDRLGHPCLMVFWTKKTEGFDIALKKINEYEELYPGRFDFYSFNLDGLPDKGESTLSALGLKWTALQLPGGKKNQTFRTYGRREPVSILVNAYGYTLLTPTGNYGRGHGGEVNPYKIDDVRITSERYLSQLQSLFIGDFLVTDTGVLVSGELKASLDAIQKCFTPVPLRYRLTPKEALVNYQKAEQLCRDAIAKHAKDPDLWRVSNRKIIALLGLWKMDSEPKFLEQAVKESRALLVKPLPEGADLVSRFCLAKAKIRVGELDAKSILSDLIHESGGSEASGVAVAAAAVLALEANSRELHDYYRGIILEKHLEDPVAWPVTTFLLDRYHTLDLLKVKLSRPERRIRARYGGTVSPRAHAVNHGLDSMTRRLPDIVLKTLEGGTINLPENNEGKLTLLLFVEPPVDPGSDFPVRLDGKGQPTKNDPLRSVMGYAFEFAERHIHKEVEVIAAFLCDDADRVRELMEKNEWSCRAAMVPGGLNNPMVQQLGVLSSDRIPNVFLLRRDGTVAWHTSGFSYKSDYGYPFAVRLAMKVHIEVSDTELAYRALAEGDFKKAKRVFLGPFLPEKDERYQWRGPRFHGRALANIGLKDWGAALADIDEAIKDHQEQFKLQPSESMVEMQTIKAMLLEKIGRIDEAKAARRVASVEPVEYPTTTIYEEFHDRLKQLKILSQP
jgi:tetratricopeptide (TPR) repeat protein